jgi:hypothetical protein
MCRTSLWKTEVEVEVEFKLRPTLSRPVRLFVRHPSGNRDQFFFLLDIFFRQLRVCYSVALSLKRGRVCNLLYNCFWSSPEQPLLGRSPAELTPIFYCLIWDSPTLEGQVYVFISPRNRVAQLYSRALGPLSVAPYDSQDYGGGILARFHTGLKEVIAFFPLIRYGPQRNRLRLFFVAAGTPSRAVTSNEREIHTHTQTQASDTSNFSHIRCRGNVLSEPFTDVTWNLFDRVPVADTHFMLK